MPKRTQPPIEAYLLKASGESTTMTPTRKNGKFTLEEMQQAVGGYIEIIQLPHSMLQLVANEEGKLHGLPINHRASEMAGQMIVGDVIICSRRHV